MKKLIEINDEEILVEILNRWSEENKGELKTNKNFWKRNKIGAILKNKLTELGHWKNKTIRNNPKGNINSLKLKENIAPILDKYKLDF